jgi:hypothetical protein
VHIRIGTIAEQFVTMTPNGHMHGGYVGVPHEAIVEPILRCRWGQSAMMVVAETDPWLA